MHKGQSLEEAIRGEAERLGFVACGIARVEAVDSAGLDLRNWLEAGYHGTMDWMESRADQRISPQALWPEARVGAMLGEYYADTGARVDAARADGDAGGGDRGPEHSRARAFRCDGVRHATLAVG